jgi:hypothetical protein
MGKRLWYSLLVQYCFILPSGLTFSVYVTLWAYAVACHFLRLCKTWRSAILENDRSHIYVFIQTVKFWKRIFSYMSAWLPTVPARPGLTRPNKTSLLGRAGRFTKIVGPGGSVRENRWTGRAKLFVGLIWPDVFTVFFYFLSNFIPVMSDRNW